MRFEDCPGVCCDGCGTSLLTNHSGPGIRSYYILERGNPFISRPSDSCNGLFALGCSNCGESKNVFINHSFREINYHVQ